jgi:hypothetical protein
MAIDKIPTLGAVVNLKAINEDPDFGGQSVIVSVSSTFIPTETGTKVSTAITTRFSIDGWEDEETLAFEQIDGGSWFYLPSSEHDAFGRIEVLIEMT